jgi:ADP-ribosyl-[dinitrogen reductase] hydrolase
MTTPGMSDRARGALLGLAAGDALGAPLVGMGREQARIKHATVTTFQGGGLYLLAPGVPTARVDMARAAAVALLQEPPLEEHLRAGYLQVLDRARPGLGEATHASLQRMQDGMASDEAVPAAHEAVERKTAGIGPAIRAVPYALRHHASPDRLADAVLADAALTHADARAGAAALALALWVREHLLGEDDAGAAFERVARRMGERPELPDVLPAPAAVECLDVRATAFAPDVLHAVARHVIGAKRAKKAVVGAVNEAGAAAALGAATGAVAGAIFGEEGLPEAWTSLLEGAHAWRTLADRLVAAEA